MSHEPPSTNPSQTVERIREIIVGRHFDKLEQRVALLEQSISNPADGPPDTSAHLEAKMETLEHQFHQFSHAVRMENEGRDSKLHEEIRRLADHIQRSLAAQSPGNVAQLEKKLGEWLGQWQLSAHQQTVAREHELVAYIHREINTLRSWVQSQLSRVNVSATSPHPDFAPRFALIAQAARALAQAADPALHPGNPSFQRQ